MMVAGASVAALRLSRWAAAAAIAALAANWFGDSLDGTLARVRGHQRPRYGFYVDHMLDLAGISCLFAGLACSGIMHPVLAVSLLSAYLLVTAESFLATHATAVFRMSWLGVGPTELRIIFAAGLLKAAVTPRISVRGLGTVRLFDVGGVIAIAGLAAVFVWSAFRTARELYAAEPLARADSARSFSAPRRRRTG
jgi:archaetidylinositol phosphate synthase